MAIKFFNTMTRKKDTFKPLHKGEVCMYSCGPTVYAPPHIGNMRSFVVSDLIRRYLEFKGLKVKLVMNLTDIDDKTIRDSGKENVPLKEFTKKWEKVFFDSIDTLNIKHASVYPRPTEHIDDMLNFVRELVRKGFAYEKSGSVYFSISKFKNYGKLARLNLKGMKIGATIDAEEYDKDNPRDFVLLKRSTTDELKRGIFYKTEWGNVRPGWHLECSVMSMKYLGETFDIHNGGVDLIFPHHENEIAQSEAYTGKQFVKYWIHNEHLIVNGKKMSKSLGNYITLDDLIKKLSPEIVRYMLVSVHYRQKLNYTEGFAESAKRNYEKLKESFDKLKFAMKFAEKNKSSDEKFLKKLKELKEKFEEAMDDDLNTPLALSIFHELAKEANKYLEKSKNEKDLKKALGLFDEFSEVLGLKFEMKEEKLAEDIEELIEKRERARKENDWKTSDQIRDGLRKRGIVLEDTPQGIRWKKLKN